MATYKNIMVLEPPKMTVRVTDTAASILRATDWTQLGDSGLTDSCKTAFATYRAANRTIRRTDPDNPTWPTVPTEEWS